MPDLPDILRQETTVPGVEAAVAMLLQPFLAQAAGADSLPASLTLDFGEALVEGQTVCLEAWIDRQTRSLIFAHGRVLGQSGHLIASGSAIFRRVAPISSTPDRQS